MNDFRRFRLMVAVLPVVLGIIALKVLFHVTGIEFLALDGLIPSLVAGAIFLIGFLLSHVLSDYKEAERTVSEMRVALEAIHGDARAFGLTRPEADLAPMRAALIEIVTVFEACLGREHAHGDLSPAIARVDALDGVFAGLERAQMSERYIVRLRGAHDALRRAMFRVAYIQRMQFVPSVHVMVQSLVVSCIFVLLFLKTTTVLEGSLVVGFVSYMFVYAIFLVRHLEKPFRKGEHTVDDVSIFLLRDFAAKVAAEGLAADAGRSERVSPDPGLNSRHPDPHQGGGADEDQEAVHGQKQGLGQAVGV